MATIGFLNLLQKYFVILKIYKLKNALLGNNMDIK